MKTVISKDDVAKALACHAGAARQSNARTGRARDVRGPTGLLGSDAAARIWAGQKKLEIRPTAAVGFGTLRKRSGRTGSARRGSFSLLRQIRRMTNKKIHVVQGTLFEEDFLVRSLGSIAHSADVALTELVANAWDAGASEVRISIPQDYNQDLVVEDDGCGMTVEQFRSRWMTLGYDRTKHQGRKADFPPERHEWRRMAFGRNGVGRHGLLCFADHYEVETCRDGKAQRFVVATSRGDDPFILLKETPSKRKLHGTTLKARMERNLLPPDRIREVLAARFLHDPKFTVLVNNRSVPLTEHPGLLEQTYIDINPKVKVEVIFIDSTQVAKTIKHQGVAFWVGGRLVGEPSWTWGRRVFIDGRTHFAKRYTVVVKTDALFDEVLPDWSDFKRSELMDCVFEKLDDYIKAVFQRVSTERIQETKEIVFRENVERLRSLSMRARHEVAEFVEEISKDQPTMQPETISVAVQAMINLDQSHSGASLIQKLAKLSDEDIEGLDRLLSEWTVRDALTVLDEIDRRIATLDAIKKLSAEVKTDELHTLHPLVTQARWLFGPDFDSAEYASNVSLRSAVNKVFGSRLGTDAFKNSKKRPDLVILNDASLSAVAIEGFDEKGLLATMKHVLILELKKGASAIGRSEMHQAVDYVQDLQKCGLLDGPPFIDSFVVGHAVDDKVERFQKLGEKPELGRIQATTYGQLVRTGEARLFKLRDSLQERYDEVKGSDLLARVLKEPRQQDLIR
jgi:hypothetical protein